MPLTRRELLQLGLLEVIAASAATGQELTFSTSVNVVSVLANVTDRQGHIITNLDQDNFRIYEDGRPQTIRYFSAQSDLPLLLGLLIDSSMSQAHVITPERSAAFHFLDQVLRPRQDQVFVMQFDMGILVNQELTSSWKDLNAALEGVDTPTRKELQNDYTGGTLLYDALVRGTQLLRNRQGRKALIVLTDGLDHGSDADLAGTVDTAQKADVLIYSILFSDSGGHSGGGVLQRLSRDSGGGYFEVSKKLGIDQVFAAIQQQLRNQYNLGYVSDLPPTGFAFRKIELKTKDKDYRVQARNRYYAHPY